MHFSAKYTVGLAYSQSLAGSWPKIVHLITKMSKDNWVDKVRTFALHYTKDGVRWFDVDKMKWATQEDAVAIADGEKKYDELQRIDSEKEVVFRKIGDANFIACYGCNLEKYWKGKWEEDEWHDGRWETDKYTFLEELYEEGWREFGCRIYCPVCHVKEVKKYEAEQKKQNKKKR